MQNRSEDETQRRACTLSIAISAEKLGTLTVLRNDDSLADFADGIWLMT